MQFDQQQRQLDDHSPLAVSRETLLIYKTTLVGGRGRRTPTALAAGVREWEETLRQPPFILF
jgi:hypothetical protein